MFHHRLDLHLFYLLAVQGLLVIQVLTPTGCPAYVMAGGASSRFGSDKAFLDIQGEQLASRLTHQLSAIGHRTIFVGGNAARFRQLRIDMIPDAQAGLGPMVGILSALRHRLVTGPGYCLILTCDLLCWKAEWFSLLSTRAMADDSAWAICFPRHSDDLLVEPDPFPGLYHTDAIASLENEIQNSRRAMQAFLRKTGWLQADVGVEKPGDWTVNTQEELNAVLDRFPDLHDS